MSKKVAPERLAIITASYGCCWGIQQKIDINTGLFRNDRCDSQTGWFATATVEFTL